MPLRSLLIRAFLPLAGLALAIPAAEAATAFHASPQSHALIVFDATLRQKSLLASNESPVVSGVLRVRTPGAKRGVHEPSATAIADVLPFAVEPGRYRPAYVVARTPRLQAGTGTVDLRVPLPTDSLAALEQTVQAGAVIYLGRLDILSVPRPFKLNEYRFAVSYDIARERQVWEQLLEKTPTGAWEEAIRGRLAALSAVSDTAATPLAAPVDSTR